MNSIYYTTHLDLEYVLYCIVVEYCIIRGYRTIFTYNIGSWAGEVSHVEIGEEAEGGGSRPVDASARISPAWAEYLQHVIAVNILSTLGYKYGVATGTSDSHEKTN